VKRLSWSGVSLCGAATLFIWAAGQAVAAQTAPAQTAPAPAAISKEDADGIIFERQQTMLSLEKNADMMGSIVAGEVPPDKLAETARAIANDAKDSYESFKQNVAGGRAKPEVWANWPDFSARMEAFVKNTEATAKLAESGGSLTAVTSTLGDALPCKQCHDVYRVPKAK
jgi:cytochrome c556